MIVGSKLVLSFLLLRSWSSVEIKKKKKKKKNDVIIGFLWCVLLFGQPSTTRTAGGDRHWTLRVSTAHPHPLTNALKTVVLVFTSFTARLCNSRVDCFNGPWKRIIWTILVIVSLKPLSGVTAISCRAVFSQLKYIYNKINHWFTAFHVCAVRYNKTDFCVFNNLSGSK